MPMILNAFADESSGSFKEQSCILPGIPPYVEYGEYTHWGYNNFNF